MMNFVLGTKLCFHRLQESHLPLAERIRMMHIGLNPARSGFRIETSMDSIDDTLRQVFGLHEFRPFQREIIEQVRSGGGYAEARLSADLQFWFSDHFRTHDARLHQHADSEERPLW